ncbi:MAG: hypothetical protein NTV00_07095 [Methylococcales bacterium]|nr:hypothetical protein [Methylococcales bacterium]
MLHGSGELADGWLTGAYTAAFVGMAISSGFGIVLPNARTNYVVDGYFYPRWESETQLNPDVDFINDIIDKLVPYYNQSVTIEKRIDKIFLLGGSSGGMMASRIALQRRDIAGLVILNGANADQVTLDEQTIVFTDANVIIPAGHCPTLIVASTFDDLLPMANRMVYAEKLFDAGVSVERIVFDGGDHGWNAWAVGFHKDIVGWLRR